MHAATVDLMMKKAHFESETAMAIAEAFDIAIQHAQLVTVSMLDVRLAQFQVGIDERFGKMEARFLALEARVGSLEAKMEVRFALHEERLDKRLEALKAELVRWVFLVMLGNVAISAAVNALMGFLR